MKSLLLGARTHKDHIYIYIYIVDTIINKSSCGACKYFVVPLLFYIFFVVSEGSIVLRTF